ncbi:MAG: hypothetical protein PHV32_12970, partial [Eubacteriales bacterium]|nr:hypothetical protein [Eubacteriales bacterium]
MDHNNVVSLKGFRKQNLPYIHIWIIYYAWVVAFATWWTASPLTENVFGSDIRSMMHAINLFSSAIFIITIRKEWFVTMARIGAVLLVVSMGAFLAVPSASVQLICAVIIGISLGCVNAAIIIPFAFTLNNTEKLYAVIAGNLLISLISLFQNSNAGNSLLDTGDMIFSYIILLLALSAIIFFKKNDIPLNTDNKGIDTAKPPSGIYLALFINCTFAILCKGVGKGILDIAAEDFGQPVVIWYYIGGLIGCLIYFLIYAFTTQAYIILVNFSFAFVSLGFLCNAFATQAPEMAVVFSVLLGTGSTIGMINMYYIIGVIGKKYNSMRYLRLSIVLIGICGGVSGVIVGNLIHRINTFEISVIFSVVSVAILLLIMILTPLLTQHQDFSVWAKDSEMPEIDNEQLYLFSKYQLSKREIEVCKLLLHG